MTTFEGKHLAKGMTSVDLRTGKETPLKGTMRLMAPRPGVCQQCAVDHKEALPHNAQSLAYQYWFYNENGRWPDWRDAWAHCTPEMQAHWRVELTKVGVDIDAGRINPTKAASP